jgi:hypothetical protein
MASSLAAPRVVAAVGRELRARLGALLHECGLRFVQTGSDLVRALDEAHCDLMIIEVHIDESAAVAALRCVRSRGDTCRVVIVGAGRNNFRHAVLDTLRMALGAVGAHDFIDLVDYPDDAEGNQRARAAFEPLLRACGKPERTTA